ncbi:MAG: hypothetical protein V3574_00500 [Candidatus Moraniibacteriota bacterium]
MPNNSILKEVVMDWEIIFRLAVFYAGGFLTIVFGAITWRLIKISPDKYRKLQKSGPSWVENLFGIGEKIQNPIVKNYRQRIFPAVDTNTNQWEARGTLADNSLHDL